MWIVKLVRFRQSFRFSPYHRAFRTTTSGPLIVRCAALKIRGTAIVLLDTKAQQLINTNRSFGEPLPRAINTEMLDRAVETGKPQISDLIIGAVLRRPVLTVGVPVFRDASSRVIGNSNVLLVNRLHWHSGRR